MTDIETALNIDPSSLGEDYMGKAVSSTSVKIMRAGDGLSKQLEIEPRILIPGERYRVLLEGVAGDHTHKLIDKADTWELVQVLNAETVTFVDDKNSESKLRKAKDRVAKHEEKKKGKERLDGMDANDLEPPEEDDDNGVTSLDSKRAAAGERPDPEWDENDQPQ